MMYRFGRIGRATWACAVLAALVVVLAGCESKPALAPVTGTVTHAGQPVVGANVMFQPEKGLPSGAVTGDDGRFELQMPNGRRPGAIPGKHAVSVLKPSAEQPPPMGGSPLPPPPPVPTLEFHTEVEVKMAGPNDFKFDIPARTTR